MHHKSQIKINNMEYQTYLRQANLKSGPDLFMVRISMSCHMTHYFFLVIIALFVTFSHLSTLNFFNIQTQSIQQADCLPYCHTTAMLVLI